MSDLRNIYNSFKDSQKISLNYIKNILDEIVNSKKDMNIFVVSQNGEYFHGKLYKDYRTEAYQLKKDDYSFPTLEFKYFNCTDIKIDSLSETWNEISIIIYL